MHSVFLSSPPCIWVLQFPLASTAKSRILMLNAHTQTSLQKSGSFAGAEGSKLNLQEDNMRNRRLSEYLTMGIVIGIGAALGIMLGIFLGKLLKWLLIGTIVGVIAGAISEMFKRK